MTSESSWNQIRKNTTVKDILASEKRDGEVVFLKENDSLRKVLEVLHNNNILSAPVIRRATILEEEGTVEETSDIELPLHISRIVGMVDVLDITGFLLHEWDKLALDTPFTNNSTDPREQIFNTPVKCILNYSCADLAITVSELASLSAVIKLFSDTKPFQRQHRLIVVNSDNRVVDILSQSDVVRWLRFHALHSLPNGIEMKSVKELGLVKSSIMVSVGTSCYDALDVLYRNRASGIAIVNFKGELATNFSASDLRGITPDSFTFFHNSVLDFLLQGTDSGLSDPITCTEMSTLFEVVNHVVSNRIHRIYVVNPTSMRPLGVITLSDIIRLLNVQALEA